MPTERRTIWSLHVCYRRGEFTVQKYNMEQCIISRCWYLLLTSITAGNNNFSKRNSATAIIAGRYILHNFNSFL